MLVIFMLVIQLSFVALYYRRRNLTNSFVYKISSVLKADQYMENLAIMFKKVNEKSFMLRLFSLLKLHFDNCQDVRCLCFLMQIRLKRSEKIKRLIDQLERRETKKNNLKLILYDDKVAMTALRLEYKIKQQNIEEDEEEDDMSYRMDESEELIIKKANRDPEDQYTNVINLKSKDVTIVFASFYNILLSNLQKHKFLLFTSYLSFLIFEVNNYVGAMINTYNYVFSIDFQEEMSMYKNIILQNYLDISSKRLHQQFLDSPFWLSNERIYEVFLYFDEVDTIEEKFGKVTKYYTEFFQELSYGTVNFKIIIEKAQKIVQLKKTIESQFTELFKRTHDNTKLLSLYINYELNINLSPETKLKDQYEKLQFLFKHEKDKTLREIIEKKNEFNCFSSRNMILFVNILKSQFFISKFTSNTPKYFEFEAKKMVGCLLSDLLPYEIKKKHDRFLLDFVNQKFSPIIKTASLTSFAITKSGELKIVTVIVKLEYYLTDDIYLCGIIIPHPRNRDRLILSNRNGKIIALNNKAKKIFGTKIVENPYSLFLSIPLLMKYFYPEIEGLLRFNKFSQRAGKKKSGLKDFGQNFEMETETFGALLFTYFLDDSCNLKGIVKKNKEGILNNFGFDDLTKWELLRTTNRKMILPKHLRILSRVITKNRQLIKDNVDKILQASITIETYKHRGDLTFKLIVISSVSTTRLKIQKFYKKACEKLKGEMADVFIVHPKDINNLCEFFFNFCS